MKRVWALLLILAMLMPLVGCQQADDALEASAAGTTVAPLSGAVDPLTEPEPTPEPTAIPVVELKDYAYETLVNEKMHVSFKHPTHWINIPGTDTISFVEPVPDGDMPARVSVTSKDAGKIIVTEEIGMDKLTAFRKSLKSHMSYENFKVRKRKRMKFAKNVGFYFTYTAELGGVPVTGFCVLTYSKPKTNRFIVLHFYCPTAKYKNFDKIRKAMVNSVSVVK